MLLVPGKATEARRRFLSTTDDRDCVEPLRQLWALFLHYKRCAEQKLYDVGEVSCTRSYTFAIPGLDFAEDLHVPLKYNLIEIFDELLCQVGRLEANVDCPVTSDYNRCVDHFVGLSQHVFNACTAYTDFGLNVLLRSSSISSPVDSDGREAARITQERFVEQTFNKLPDLLTLLRLG